MLTSQSQKDSSWRENTQNPREKKLKEEQSVKMVMWIYLKKVKMLIVIFFFCKLLKQTSAHLMNEPYIFYVR